MPKDYIIHLQKLKKLSALCYFALDYRLGHNKSYSHEPDDNSDPLTRYNRIKVVDSKHS